MYYKQTTDWKTERGRTFSYHRSISLYNVDTFFSPIYFHFSSFLSSLHPLCTSSLVCLSSIHSSLLAFLLLTTSSLLFCSLPVLYSFVHSPSLLSPFCLAYLPLFFVILSLISSSFLSYLYESTFFFIYATQKL